VCRLLNRRRVRYLVAGGAAVNLHGVARTTRDVDVLVPRDLANARRLLEALAELPYGMASEIDPAELVRKPVTIIGDDPRVDVLTVAWTVRYEPAARSRSVRRIAGTRVPFLSLADLLRSKRTGRPQDVADVEGLKNVRRASPGRVARKRSAKRVGSRS
jgi:hypothetical protein